jgi:DNA-binding NtrC family response regulator
VFTIAADGKVVITDCERCYSLWELSAVVVDNYLPGQDEGLDFCRLVAHTTPKYRSMILFTRRDRAFPVERSFWTLPKPIDPGRAAGEQRKFLWALSRCRHLFEVGALAIDVPIIWAENVEEARSLLPASVVQSAVWRNEPVSDEEVDVLRYARGYVEIRRNLDKDGVKTLSRLAEQIVMPIVVYVPKLGNELVDLPERLADHANLRLVLTVDELADMTLRLQLSPTVVGLDPAVREAFGELARCARKSNFVSCHAAPGDSRYAVMIYAPKGSGKELAFSYYHAFGDKLYDSTGAMQEPVVVFPSGAGSEAVRDFRIELFGFGNPGTGNVVQGLLETNRDNTFVIDEFQDCGAIVQGSMRRAVERGGPVSRVSSGAGAYFVQNIRFAFVTMSDPMDPASKFDEAMVTRCRVIPFPGLDCRVRGEKSLLATYLLLKKDAGLRFSTGAIDLIESHSWVGNVRQLKEFVDKMVLTHNKSDEGLRPVLTEEEVRLGLQSVVDGTDVESFSRDKTEDLASRLCDGSVARQLRELGRTCSWKSTALLDVSLSELRSALLYVFFARHVGSWRELAELIHHPYNMVKDDLPRLLGPISRLKQLRSVNSSDYEAYRGACVATLESCRRVEAE